MTSEAQDGREKLAKVLDREVEMAKDHLASALEQTRVRILDAQRALQDGLGVATTVSGQGMVLGQEGSRIDEYVGLYMAAEQRRVRLLDLYDEVNGTSEPKTPEEAQAEMERWNDERVGDGPDFGMYSVEGNAKVAEIAEKAAADYPDLDAAWESARKALFALAEAPEQDGLDFAEAGDTAVRDCVYEDLRLRFA